MRSLLAATALILVAASAAAQTPATPAAPRPSATPAPAGPPKPSTPAIARPAVPVDPAAQAERLALQSDLAWAAEYNGAITGEANERMTAALKAFQKNNGGKITGTLTSQERTLLADAAKKQQDNVGWAIVSDAATGTRLGVPLKLVPQQSSNADSARWASTTGTIQIVVSRRKEAAATIAAVAEREKKEPAGRRIDYTAMRPDFFVLSGMQGLKKFYVRGQTKDGDVKLMTILYDQATEGTMAPVVIAMSSSFTAFPTGVQAGVPAPRKKVEYATGVVVSADGAIVTNRAAVEACQSIVISGHGNAERVAEDKSHGLALLRLHGARGLTPVAISAAAIVGSGDIVGIADPQSQGGAAAVSSVKASVTQDGSAYAVSPAPGAGFAGATFVDSSGKLVGIVEPKPSIVAAANGAPVVSQAILAPAATVRTFMKANGITVSDAVAGDTKASVLRVICVRK